jgi:low temperature requirement protein LtrA
VQPGIRIIAGEQGRWAMASGELHQRVERDGRGVGLLRPAGEGGHEVTSFELFFDLVFVFAVTQLSHLLLGHLTLMGAAQTLLLLLAIWWVWVDTTWVTNWFDPNHPVVRLMLIVVMLVSLIMSALLPEAFDARGIVFAGAYVLIQVGRTAFVVTALDHNPTLQRNFLRVLTWMVLSGCFWIAGGLAHDGTRMLLWLAAVGIDMLGPVVAFYTPGLGRSPVREWTIVGGHLAERFQLFVIVSLGESIVVTGTTFGERELADGAAMAFVLAFASTVALWWIYFNRSARYGSSAIASARDPGRLGRSAYTYFHLPMVAGIIVTAVADELTIAHPNDPAALMTVLVACGGPILFLAGHFLYKQAVSGYRLLSHLAGIVVLMLLVPVGLTTTPLLLSVATTLTLIGVVAWDGWVAHRLLHQPIVATDEAETVRFQID